MGGKRECLQTDADYTMKRFLFDSHIKLLLGIVLSMLCVLNATN